MLTIPTRRDFLKMGASALAGGLLPSIFTPAASAAPKIDIKRLIKGKIDYTKAQATPTICFGCTNHCGVIGWVQDGRVRKIEGNPLDPNSEGNICAKAQGMISYTYYPERLLYPLRRVGKRGEGKWKRVTWDQALDELAAKLRPLREKGIPEEFVFHYGRDKTKGFTKRFTNAFGTPHRLNRRSICSSNRRAPLMSYYGRDFEWETQDLENTKYVVNFGANPMEAYQGGLYMMHRLRESQANKGTKMVTFEVRPSATASVSQEYHPIMPGTDGAVAFAMIHVILKEGLEDEQFWNRWANYHLADLRKLVKDYTPEWAEKHSGIAAADIKRIAIEFAQAAPACCTMSNRGSAKHYNGVQSDRAIRMLDVLVGNVGKPGGFCLTSGRGWSGKYGQEGLPKLSQPGPKPPSPPPWGMGEGFNEVAFKKLPQEIQDRVNHFPDHWRKKYYGELATPSEFPLAWHWYQMRVGQLVYPYIKQGLQKVSVYMSFTLGASYGYPEANVAREVLLDEKLIPFHVAIDIGYSEQAAIADLILPEATSLERWDYHSTNCYGLIPYTGVRQPLVKAAGESLSVQEILRDLSRKIGGGMEKYFQMDDIEAFYKDWYKNLPVEWEEFKKRGIWQDATRDKDYQLYERHLTKNELAGTSVVDGLVKNGKKTVGIMMDGKAIRGFPTPTRKIQVYDEIWPIAARAVGLPMTDVNASPIAIYDTVPEHKDLADDRYIFSTFKWNVHTQGRTAHWKYHSEIIHTNPIFMHPATGKSMGLKEGDSVRLSVFRPHGHTYRSGEKEIVGSFENHVRFLKGMHPKVMMCSHHTGHSEHGAVARAEENPSAPKAGVTETPDEIEAKTLKHGVWWSKKKGGLGGGVHINDALPINPCPLTGGQNWYDNVCKIEKI